MTYLSMMQNCSSLDVSISLEGGSYRRQWYRSLPTRSPIRVEGSRFMTVPSSKRILPRHSSWSQGKKGGIGVMPA